MTVYVVIQCDICGVRYERPGTNHGLTFIDAIREDGWQKVSYQIQSSSRDDAVSITEVRCPACVLPTPTNVRTGNSFL